MRSVLFAFLLAAPAPCRASAAPGMAEFSAGLQAVEQAARELHGQPPEADEDLNVRRAADALASRIAADPGDLSDVLAAEFRVHRLIRQGLMAEFAKLGKVERIEPLGPRRGRTRDFLFHYSGGRVRGFEVTASADGRVAGLEMHAEALPFASPAEVAQAVAALPGQANFVLARLDGGGRTLAAHQPDVLLPLGSAHKLYTLAALAESGRAWESVVRLRAEWKSQPSGQLHQWPDGSPITLHSLATLMISNSDNTATDHLLHIVGRETVERSLAGHGHGAPARTIPFLSTAEMFRLKQSPALLERWLGADLAGRRAMLATELAGPGFPAGAWEDPLEIHRVEWFASAADMVRLMDHFRRTGDPTALEVMGVNPGLSFPKGVFPYAGFKGGSEPGVLNLTFLAKAADGRDYAFSFGWADTAAEVDESRLLLIAQGLIYLLAKGG